MLHSVQLRCCHEMHVANSTKCNCIFTVRVSYAFVISSGNLRSHIEVYTLAVLELALLGEGGQMPKCLKFCVSVPRD